MHRPDSHAKKRSEASAYLFAHGKVRHIVLILILASGTLMGGSTTAKHDITGYVYDLASGESLPYANVVLFGTGLGAVTNKNGYFVIVNAPTGNGTLKVSYIGYKSAVVSINNQAGSSEPVRIGLELEVIGLEGVEVIGENYTVWKKAENPSQLTLSPHQLEFLPNFGDVDIFRSLQLLPGISGINDGSSGLYVRGGTPDQNLVILDGMTVYHVDHFFGMFSAFNADAIKDVQVYKGGFPAKYGDRLSSVIELTGKNGDQNRRQMSAGLNLLSANLLYETPLFSNCSWLISARRSYTDLIQSPLYNSIYSFVTGESSSSTPSGPQGGMGGRGGAFTAEVVPSFYFYDLNSKLSWTPSQKDFMSISFYNGKDKLDKSRDLSNIGFRGMDSLETGTRTDKNLTDWGNLGGSVRWARQWHQRFYTNAILSYSEYTSNHTRNLSFNSGRTIGVADSNRVVGLGSFATNEYNTVGDLTFSFDCEWHLGSGHTIGFGNSFSQIRTNYDAYVTDTISVLNVASASTQNSVYLQDEWKPISTLGITLGLRSTYYDPTGSLYNAPRFLFNWAMTDRLKLKGAWGYYYQFINNITNENVLEGSHDFWLTAENHLKPGFSEHRILGLSYETPLYLIEIEGYHKTLDHLVEFSRRFQYKSDYLQYFFFGSGVSRGIEFLVQKKFGQFNGWISYTLGQVRYTFPKLNDGKSFTADQDRTHEVKLIGSYQRGPWNFSATWVFATGQPYTAPESQYYLDLLDGNTLSYIHISNKNACRLPDYHRLDMSISRRFETENYDWNVGVSVFNLYNHKNIYYRDYDLETTPIVVSDVLMLGFTPTVFVKLNLK